MEAGVTALVVYLFYLQCLAVVGVAPLFTKRTIVRQHLTLNPTDGRRTTAQRELLATCPTVSDDAHVRRRSRRRKPNALVSQPDA